MHQNYKLNKQKFSSRIFKWIIKLCLKKHSKCVIKQNLKKTRIQRLYSQYLTKVTLQFFFVYNFPLFSVLWIIHKRRILFSEIPTCDKHDAIFKSKFFSAIWDLKLYTSKQSKNIFNFISHLLNCFFLLIIVN